ncbi:hypothetical protein Hdeb2414_s0004g00128131 [Helianthus debilis subsp. tardiflorus]
MFICVRLFKAFLYFYFIGFSLKKYETIVILCVSTNIPHFTISISVGVKA